MRIKSLFLPTLFAADHVISPYFFFFFSFSEVYNVGPVMEAVTSAFIMKGSGGNGAFSVACLPRAASKRENPPSWESPLKNLAASLGCGVWSRTVAHHPGLHAHPPLGRPSVPRLLFISGRPYFLPNAMPSESRCTNICGAR